MKSITFSIFIALYFTFILCGCENSSDHSSDQGIQPSSQIDTRTVDKCSDCPPNTCCCSVELLSDENTIIYMCGTTNAGHCGPLTITGCYTVEGGTEHFPLYPYPPGNRALFCMEKGHAFTIGSPGGLGQPTVKLSCQYNQPFPQYVILQMMSGGPVYTFNVASDCGLTQCN